MIKFSTFLQENEKKKKRADERIAYETKVIDEKDNEIARKKELLRVLKDKHGRITNQVKTMKTYENYLEKVKEENRDEYNELSDILRRYQTLRTSNDSLKES